MKKILSVAFLLIGLAWNAQAELAAVGPISAANGFPVWYQDTNGLQLELCLDQNGLCLTAEPDPGVPISFPANFGDEAFWWVAEAIGVPLTGGGTASLVLAMEAAFANEAAAAGDQVAFGRIRIRITPPTTGDYIVTHPFGQVTLTGLVGGATVTFTQDIGNFLDPGPAGDFTLALADDPAQAGTVNADGRSIGPFLVPADSGYNPLPFLQRPEGTYIADPVQLNRVIGSPIADAAHLSGFRNYFRVERDGAVLGETELFNLMGKVAFCGPENVAPVANPDFGAALGGAVTIEAAANDTDDSAVNPAAIAIAVQGAKGTAVRHADGTITYTPNPGAGGKDTFTYTVQDFCGLPSASVTETVLIEPAEDLQAVQADYRSALGKWLVRGSSSIDQPVVRLSGANEVPPVASDARGFAMVNINEAGDAIDYALMIDQAPATAFEQAHIHVGASGVNGPIILFLCTNLGNAPAGVTVPACPTATGLVEGTLAAADLIPQAEQGIDAFADALAAIRSGNAYVNAHTVANPGGEIRGQIGNFVTLRTGAAGAPMVGTAVVQPGGGWLFDGKAKASPGADPRTVGGESTTGAVFTIPLRLR